MQHAKEPLGLIELRAVLGREMKDMAVARIAQESLALGPLFEGADSKGTRYHRATKAYLSKL